MKAPSQPDQRRPGRFYRPGTADDAIFLLQRLEPKGYRLWEPFEYVDHLGVIYTIPFDVASESNSTDLASIPPFLTWLVPKDGRHTPAAILHDALIGGTVGVDYLTSTGEQVDDAHADYVFREAMKDLGVRWLRRWLMWCAVTLRTVSYDNRHSPARLRVGSVVVTSVAAVALAIISALMALDVPDLGSRELPWLADRPWYSEIARALGQIVVGAAAFALVLSAVYRSLRVLGAGLLGGLAIGFFGLPMVASLVGAAGYLLLEWLIGTVKS